MKNSKEMSDSVIKRVSEHKEKQKKRKEKIKKASLAGVSMLAVFLIVAGVLKTGIFGNDETKESSIVITRETANESRTVEAKKHILSTTTTTTTTTTTEPATEKETETTTDIDDWMETFTYDLLKPSFNDDNTYYNLLDDVTPKVDRYGGLPRVDRNGGNPKITWDYVP